MPQVRRQLPGRAQLAGRVLPVRAAFPRPDRIIERTVGEAVVAAFLERPAAFERSRAGRQLGHHLALSEIPDKQLLAEVLEIHLGERLLVVVHGSEAGRHHAVQVGLDGHVVHVRRALGQIEPADELAVVGELGEPRG